MDLKTSTVPKFLYSVKDSFNKLTEIQDMALNPELNHGTPNFTAALKAEELKGKLAGLYGVTEGGANINITISKDDNAL